jgi:hypothetical protein
MRAWTGARPRAAHRLVRSMTQYEAILGGDELGDASRRHFPGQGGRTPQGSSGFSDATRQALVALGVVTHPAVDGTRSGPS